MRIGQAWPWACALVLAACASSPASEAADGAPAAAPYMRAVMERVAMGAEQEHHRIRYNPVRCACPPWELELQGVWHRASFGALDPTDPVAERLDEVRRDDPEGVIEVVAGLDDDAIETCARGALVVTMALEGLVVDLPPELPEED